MTAPKGNKQKNGVNGTSTSTRSYPCPRCRVPVNWSQAPNKPFCSERCKTLDFGAWATQEHVIPGSLQDENFDI